MTAPSICHHPEALRSPRASESRNRSRRFDVHNGMEIPKVGPLGLVDQPEGYVATARSYPLCLRVAAVSVLGSFLTVTILTTAYSLGAYCLTTWGGSPFAVGSIAP